MTQLNESDLLTVDFAEQITFSSLADVTRDSENCYLGKRLPNVREKAHRRNVRSEEREEKEERKRRRDGAWGESERKRREKERVTGIFNILSTAQGH